jgi:hypothetical protein
VAPARSALYRVAGQFPEEFQQERVARGLNLMPKPFKNMVPPLQQIGNARRESVRMQAQPKNV